MTVHRIFLGASLVLALSGRIVLGIHRLERRQAQNRSGTAPNSGPAAFSMYSESSVYLAHEVGTEMNIYVIGSSNAVWQTWPDQLHLMLHRLGYTSTPREWNEELKTLKHPCWGEKRKQCGDSSAPICDDHDDFSKLETPRLGNVGWSSWGYAYENTDDCDDKMFREVEGHRISCVNAWNCKTEYSTEIPLAPLSKVVEEASKSQLVLMANWMNDAKQRYTTPKNVCYDEEDLDPTATTEISDYMIKKVIRAIHEKNPDVIVGVMAAYPEKDDTANEALPRVSTLGLIGTLNEHMRKGLEAEPNTIFVDYHFPNDQEVLQTLNSGHPNCRGDKAMATAVVDTLFKKGFIVRGLPEVESLKAAECEAAPSCDGLGSGCCIRNPQCHVGEDGSSCIGYGPGRQ
eukprot:TRINITY_DN38247_c0_g1_i1.p1 TRINITY_DN38247_c0_g1~~TRINITY_DN38247_c0_g1_i1.p1  ORF type:complete len:401 (-),score=81.20 TRINITY_DN38247_c0_g1_i1:150-1352(-)